MRLTKRPCKIGSSINTRAEGRGGDESVPAFDIPLKGLMLSAKELDELIGEDAHAHLFTAEVDGKPAEPVFKQFDCFKVKGKFEDCEAVFTLGLAEDEVTLTAAKVSKVELRPQVGGMTQVDCTVQCTPDVEAMATLFVYMDHDVEVEIVLGARKQAGKDKQQELGMPASGDDDDGEAAGATPAGPNGGGQPQAPDGAH